ncbi:MAG: FecR domain-containing protein [Candidatus Omnitrophica bacterium]|nr:FecR domain-containing protein [Candidatus Omnitrophota bacterium]
MRHILNDKILSRYADERLDAALSQKVKGHIEGCSSCLERAAAFKLTKRMLGSLEALEVSPSFDFEFNRRLNDALAKQAELGILERAAERAIESIKAALTPAVPALVRAAVSIIILIAIASGPFYYLAESPLNITAVSGKVAIYSSRTHVWTEASKGMALSKNDVIKTDASGEMDISVSDKYTVRVKSDTELKALSMLPRFRSGTASYEVAKGEVLVDITEKFKGSRFDVYTPQAVATALGTSFAVDVSGGGKRDKTWLGVAHGAVEVKSRYPLYAAKRAKVIVNAGQKTEIFAGQAPIPPSLLLEQEWKKMEELYQIGRRAQVVLLISATESRVRELLRPCSIYIYDAEPRTISPRLEEAVAIISEAITEKSLEKHLDAIHQLEVLVEEDKEAPYNPQLLLFIGTYYEYVSQYEMAITAFKKIIERYPDSQFASLAECAIGIIYNEKLGEKARALEAFESIISNYPNSLEELEARKALKNLKS